MFKDNLLFKDTHEEVASSIVEAFKPGLTINNGITVTIFGVSGTGKSEIAWWIARKLYCKNVSSHIVSLDRFYKVQVEEREDHRRETGVIGEEEMDFDRISEEMKRFEKNKIDVLILEGLYAGYVESSNLRIFLKGDLDSTYSFRKLRGKENPDSEWRKYVLIKEAEAILSSVKPGDETYET